MPLADHTYSSCLCSGRGRGDCWDGLGSELAIMMEVWTWAIRSHTWVTRRRESEADIIIDYTAQGGRIQGDKAPGTQSLSPLSMAGTEVLIYVHWASNILLVIHLYALKVLPWTKEFGRYITRPWGKFWQKYIVSTPDCQMIRLDSKALNFFSFFMIHVLGFPESIRSK